MGRLVPGLPGILQTPPDTHTSVSLSSSFSITHLSHPSYLYSGKIPPPLSSNLTFFSGADPGRPTLFPTARQKPALWSEPGPLCWFPLSSTLSLPWLLASPTALLYWFTPPTSAVCLCFAPLAPRSLIFITLPLFPFSLFPMLVSSFFLRLSFLTVCPLLHNHGQEKKTWQNMREGVKERWKDGGVRGETGPLIFH